MVFFDKLKNWDILSLLSTVFVAYYLTDYKELIERIDKEANELNNTKKSNQSVLVFNRTPKAGSETIWNLLDFLSKPNNFGSYSDSQELKGQRGYENCYLTNKDEREAYVNMLHFGADDNSMSVPFSYCKHLNFLNFEEFNLTNPIYVNMVRDPIERVISWFYYHRQAFHNIKRNPDNSTELTNKMPPSMFKYTYEECFEQQMFECVYRLGENIHGGVYGGSHYSQVISKGQSRD